MNQAYVELAERWQALKQDNPNVRIRNAAEVLGVSEAELLATRTGQGVTRLRSEPKAILPRIESLGEVMALTRNEAMVHEKTGQYKGLSVHGNMGLALGVIDLRVFFNRFATAFEVREDSPVGERRSLQFFDEFGEAVHKIYARDNTDMAAFDALVQEFISDDQEASVEVAPRLPLTTEKGGIEDRELDVAALEQGWSELKDVHHFLALLKKHHTNRATAYRAVRDDFAREISTSAFEAALVAAAASQLSIMVFVGSPGVIQIHTGPVSKLKRTGPWFNVLDPGFNLHADTTQIGEAWVVRKPTSDGVVTSLEVFDSHGEQLALMFGERKNGEAENPAWQQLIAALEVDFAKLDQVEAVEADS
ncbi:MAG: ChuX/HutX family heme-like substrate-binding protein [Pseudomonadota bacterium]|nr:ChuX/HutX family heme-like substrate-binding protein [Pseudomonadota bacterium]